MTTLIIWRSSTTSPLGRLADVLARIADTPHSRLQIGPEHEMLLGSAISTEAKPSPLTDYGIESLREVISD
jgi:hypothetical protein